MRRRTLLSFALPSLCLLVGFVLAGWDGPAAADEVAAKVERIDVAPADWPWWRGPDRNGHAAAGQKPPVAWSATENVVWRAPVPGRGHGSPTVVGEQVFLATADEKAETQSVLCWNRRTGKLLWETVVHRGGLVKKGHKKSSHASASVACDGARLFINFVNDGALYATALDRDGERLWQTKVSDYSMHQGFGASPAIYASLVLVAADHHDGGAVAALDRASGAIVWKNPRPKTANYTAPIVLEVAGRDQLLFTGCNLVSSFDPLTGRKLWEIDGATTECVTSTVTDGTRIFTSGGYPRNHVAAVLADGSGTVAWESNVKVYVPSLLVRDGHLYGVTDNGVAMCWKSETGEEVWKHRLGGTFSSSPVMVGELIYATNEAGRTFVFRATPEKCEPVAENQLGDEAFATPTICGGGIYLRHATTGPDGRQETLSCIADPASGAASAPR
ncbi:MAG: PQQ-binding-like beta-propeller repeat protein [Planctomycetales bacterium]